MIGLSPLSTDHPPSFQPRWVRASTRSYPRFTLPMDSSLGFGSTACDYDALFRLAFATATLSLNLATYSNSQAHYAKGTRSHLIYMVLPLLVGKRFQVLFHSPPGVLFTFPSRYWFTIGRQGILRLTGWSPQIHAGFHGSGVTWELGPRVHTFRIRDCYPLWSTLS